MVSRWSTPTRWDPSCGLPDWPTPELGGFPIPTLMLLGGVVLGVVLALACRVLVGATARRRARTADRQLRGAVREGSQEGLKAIRGLSGDIPVFDERLLQTLF